MCHGVMMLLQEMRETAQSSGMFCKIVKIRSKELQKWLGNDEDMWYQVQVQNCVKQSVLMATAVGRHLQELLLHCNM